MDFFNIKENYKVLLVGEGNFSFTCALIRRLKDNGCFCSTNIYATCLEEESYSNITEMNKSFLESEGVRVMYNVDATKLSLHPILQYGRFNTILFNFPHVGGKMKIHLNRFLLKDFFENISQEGILSINGEVFVTLCAGQSGTQFDSIKRKWDDTWQVTEMAAHGNFVLRNVVPFPHDLFPTYSSIGFRGTLKSFHTEGSMIHKFQKADFLLPLELNEEDIDNAIKLHDVGGCSVSLEYKNAIERNPLKRCSSIQTFVLNIFLNVSKSVTAEFTEIEELPLFCKEDAEKDKHNINCADRNQFSLRSSLIEVFKEMDLPHSAEHFLISDLVFRPVPPVAKCELLIVSSKREILWQRFLHAVLIYQEYLNLDCLSQYLTYFTPNYLTIDLDGLCKHIFSISNSKQVWLCECEINNDKLLLMPLSACQRIYHFDVSFGAASNPFDEDSLVKVLHCLPGDIVDSVELLSIYHPKDLQETYYCYRISYRSFELPLYRGLVVKYHQNVTCKALESIFNVKVH